MTDSTSLGETMAKLATEAAARERRLQSALDGWGHCVWDYDRVTDEVYRTAG
jgi:hypothetical protein